MAIHKQVASGLAAFVVVAGVGLALALGLFDSEDTRSVNQTADQESIQSAEGQVKETPDAPMIEKTPEVAPDAGTEAADLKPVPLSRQDMANSLTFDLVRVEPSGDAVFAGRGPASKTVIIALSQGQASGEAPVVLTTTLSSEQGDWAAVSDRPLPGGTSLVWIGFEDSEGVLYSKIHLLIEVPTTEDGEVLIAMIDAQGTRSILSGVDEPSGRRLEKVSATTDGTAVGTGAGAEVPESKPGNPQELAEAPQDMVITFIESNATMLRIGGTARNNAVLRLYINGDFVADYVASARGEFLLTSSIDAFPEGELTIRVDEIDANGNTQARAENVYDLKRPEQPLVSIEDKAVDAEKSAQPSDIEIRTVGGEVTTARLDPEKSESSEVSTADPTRLEGETLGHTADGRRVVLVDGKQYVEDFELKFSEQSGAGAPLISKDRDSRPDRGVPIPEDGVKADRDAKPQSITVARGDSLWRIAQRFYGEGLRYTVIYKKNRQQIRNPDLIYPGQVFSVPKLTRVLTPVQ